MEQREILIFGEECAEPFRLETRQDSQRQHHLRLLRGEAEIKHQKLLRPSLLLLRYLAHHAQQALFEADILNALWPHGADENIVEKHISILRNHALNDAERPHKFIETLPGQGYKFLPHVRREGNLGGIEAFEKWNRPRFYELLGKIERGREEEREDLRIVTTAFNANVSELGLDTLLQNDVRIKILMMNPDNEVLTNARFSLRQDKTKVEGLRELRKQVDELKKLASQYPPSTRSGERRGTFEYALSDIQPCGFLVHAKKWALLGVFLAHDSYIVGPMLEIRSDIELWKKLAVDWEARWTAAHGSRKKQLKT